MTHREKARPEPGIWIWIHNVTTSSARAKVDAEENFSCTDSLSWRVVAVALHNTVSYHVIAVKDSSVLIQVSLLGVGRHVLWFSDLCDLYPSLSVPFGEPYPLGILGLAVAL